MAVHRQSEPPRTLAAWHRFQEECWRQQRYDWLPNAEGYGVSWAVWTPQGADHPFKGCRWCWRCLAEAIGSPVGTSHHIGTNGTICWGQTEGNPRAENRQQDTRPPGDESTSDWTEAGRRYVAEAVGGNEVIDSGTFFYAPPPEPAPAPRRQVVPGRSLRITPLDPEGNPTGPAQDISEGCFVGFETVDFRCSCHEESSWGGFPSWTDDLPVSDLSQWPPPPVEISLSDDQADAALAALKQAREGDR